jgi:hypothetical protein
MRLVAEVALGSNLRTKDEAAAGEVCQPPRIHTWRSVKWKTSEREAKNKTGTLPRFYFKSHSASCVECIIARDGDLWVLFLSGNKEFLITWRQ